MALNKGVKLQHGKYEIIRYIASGGFGCTYQGRHALLGNVAIKEFFPNDFCNRDATTGVVTVGTESKKPLVEKLKGKFIDEALALSKMTHPHIVRVTDVFEENGTAYYVMDYIDGKSLKEILEEAPTHCIPEEKALKYIRQVSEALRYVHDSNRLHLDIKPANIMVDGNDNAILIDFGTSKQYDEANGENTSTLLGLTPGYAPSEQMSNDVTKFMPATDIYALGATLYKLITGNRPISATLRASGEEMPDLPDGVSQSTKKAIKSAMTLNKQLRPQSIDEFLAILNTKEKPQPKPQPKPQTNPQPNHQPDDDATEIIVKPKPKSGCLKWILWVIVCVAAIIGVISLIPDEPQPTRDNGKEAEEIYVDDDEDPYGTDDLDSTMVWEEEEMIDSIEADTIEAYGYTYKPDDAGEHYSQESTGPDEGMTRDRINHIENRSGASDRSVTMAIGKTYYTGQIYDNDNVKTQVNMTIVYDGNKHIEGSYCYLVSIKKYGDKPENYLYFDGRIEDRDIVLNVHKYKGSEIVEQFVLKKEQNGDLSGTVWSYEQSKLFNVDLKPTNER